MRTIELTDELVDHIVVTELKDIFLRNVSSIDDDDILIVDAVAKLLKYTMSYQEAINWINANTPK
jgi:hypothetical protein